MPTWHHTCMWDFCPSAKLVILISKDTELRPSILCSKIVIRTQIVILFSTSTLNKKPIWGTEVGLSPQILWPLGSLMAPLFQWGTVCHLNFILTTRFTWVDVAGTYFGISKTTKMARLLGLDLVSIQQMYVFRSPE